MVGFVFQVVLHRIFHQPGKRVKPLQHKKDFGKKNIERVFFFYMDIFVANNHFQVPAGERFFGKDYFAEKRKRVYIFFCDVDCDFKKFFYAAFPDNLKSVTVPQHKMKQKARNSCDVEPEKIVVPFRYKTRYCCISCCVSGVSKTVYIETGWFDVLNRCESDKGNDKTQRH